MSTYKYTWFLPGERGFDNGPSTEWMHHNWTQSAICAAIYLALIFVGQRFMKRRKAFNLKAPLILWNLALGIFSILGTIRFAPSFAHTLKNHGLVYSVCKTDFLQGPSGVWALLFALSKLPELVDTVFLVLRKRPVVFLHWYHHATVLVASWHFYHGSVPMARWCVTMNYTVHSVMYTYYALRALGFWLPKCIPMSITIMQISQMIFGCVICAVVIAMKLTGGDCDHPTDNLILTCTLYFTYLVLFANFFLQAYFVKRKYDKPKGNEVIQNGRGMDEKIDDNNPEVQKGSEMNGTIGDVHNGTVENTESGSTREPKDGLRSRPRRPSPG